MAKDFEKYYSEFLPKVYRYFVSRTGDKVFAEDLTSQTFLRALEKVHQFDGVNFGGWIFRIGRNILIDESKKNNHEDFSEELLEVDSECDLVDETNEKIVFEKLEKLFKKLDFSDIEKEIFILKIVGDLKFNEIEKMLGLSENTVKTKYFRGLAKIKPYSSDFLILLLILKLL